MPTTDGPNDESGGQRWKHRVGAAVPRSVGTNPKQIGPGRSVKSPFDVITLRLLTSLCLSVVTSSVWAPSPPVVFRSQFRIVIMNAASSSGPPEDSGDVLPQPNGRRLAIFAFDGVDPLQVWGMRTGLEANEVVIKIVSNKVGTVLCVRLLH